MLVEKIKDFLQGVEQESKPEFTYPEDFKKGQYLVTHYRGHYCISYRPNDVTYYLGSCESKEMAILKVREHKQHAYEFYLEDEKYKDEQKEFGELIL